MKTNYRNFFQSYDISTEEVSFPSSIRAHPVPVRLNLREELLSEDGY